jgi:hypothetical protein
MRSSLILACLLAACGGSSTGSSCTVDSDCSGDVCARDGQCYPSSQVRSVAITWTVSGAAPTTSSCSEFPDLTLEFDNADGVNAFEFEPVPCIEGKFTIDKLPLDYVQVDLGLADSFTAASQTIGSDNMVSFDLTP